VAERITEGEGERERERERGKAAFYTAVFYRMSGRINIDKRDASDNYSSRMKDLKLPKISNYQKHT
jgi:hypothetical protein